MCPQGGPPPGLPTRLRIGEELGRGGTARVWRARDVVAGADVVVKVLVAEGAPARLEREARALARLRDVPGVLGVRELGITPDGTAWVVTDLAPGGSLADRLAAGTEVDDPRAADPRAADPRQVVALLRSLATTLAAAHDRRVVHGDISPANVLFGVDGTPLLADFGAADLDGRSDPVRQGLTPAHAAPERRRGAPASRAGDVYSLASTVATLLTRTDVERELREVIRRATEEQPRARPSAAELVALVSGDPPERTRRGRGRRPRR